jgi:hypothetical protein
MSKRNGVAALFIVLVFSGTMAGARRVDNAAMEWNQIALAATVAASQGPLPQSRSMTMVHVAVHDAVNSITGRYQTHFPPLAAPSGASADAAAIAAAHRVLRTLFGSQAATLDPARATSLAARSLTEFDPGIAIGEGAAATVLQVRASDGASSAQFPYVAPGAGSPGVWTTIGTAQPLLAGWGNVAPWIIRFGSQFRPDAPPALDSGRWARDYNEVKTLGAANSTTRTPVQTEIARFWLGTPSAIWNGVARQVIAARALDVSDTARTFALMYLAASDAGVACWDAKYVYNFWRPQLAIQNGHLDGNDKTEAMPGWAPLFPTPPHPEYLSGHATNSSAMATMLGFLFGDEPGITLTALSPTNPGFPRQWTSFTQGVDEVIEARIYSGIHYRTSDEVGARVGRQVARFVYTHALK